MIIGHIPESCTVPAGHTDKQAALVLRLKASLACLSQNRCLPAIAVAAYIDDLNTVCMLVEG